MTRSNVRRRGILLVIRRFLAERRGVGAIEFALVAPIMILLYVGSAEVSVTLSINKKVARASSTVADLVTQQQSVCPDFLQSMVDVATAIMSPYNESPVKLTVSEIHVDGSRNASINWSWDQDGQHPYSSGDSINIPADLAIANTDLVRSDLSFDHSLFLPGAASLNIRDLTMSKT
ncbi:MAG TPA: TadE/TadG family type IV pilus assembly protein, partial [Pararhizobium sp.]|nr:TadE/TadG family type IV pilus assembly protein [Pararhizobium sp.]